MDNEPELTAQLLATYIADAVRRRSMNLRAALIAYEAARDVLLIQIAGNEELGAQLRSAAAEIVMLEEMWTRSSSS